MGRPPRFTNDQVLDAAAAVLVADGIRALSVSEVAHRLGGPSGSIYHRFASRDVLVASLWLRSVERFHRALAVVSTERDGLAAVELLAASILAWVRDHPVDAQILLLHRSTELVRGDLPHELAERNEAQRRRVDELIDTLCARLGASADADRQRVVFAAIELPYSAARGPLTRGLLPPPELDAIVADAVRGVLAPLRSVMEEAT